MKKWIITICVMVCTAGAWADVVFNDTFNTADSQDINAGYVARQAGGSITAQYTELITSVAIAGNKFYQEGKGYVSLDTDLDAYLTGEFTVSFTMAMSATPVANKYSCLFLQNTVAATTVSTARFGMQLFSARNSPTYSFMNFYGGTGSQEITKLTTTELQTLWNAEFGEDFDGTDVHTYEFIADGAADTYDVIIDGLTMASDIAYAFVNSDVTLKFYGAATSAEGGNSAYDDLTLEAIPEPATMGMIGFSAIGLIMFRRLHG